MLCDLTPIIAPSLQLAVFHRISDSLVDAGSDLDMAQLANDPELRIAREVADKACGVLAQAARESVVGSRLGCWRCSMESESIDGRFEVLMSRCPSCS